VTYIRAYIVVQLDRCFLRAVHTKTGSYNNGTGEGEGVDKVRLRVRVWIRVRVRARAER
jgi:hypothetical protein